MSKTIKHEHRSNLFKNGERGHHNSLRKELREANAVIISDCRLLLDRQDYESSRLGGWRKCGNGKRRAYLKRQTQKEIIENC